MLKTLKEFIAIYNKMKEKGTSKIEKNKEDIKAWVYSLIFVTVIPSIDGNITFDFNITRVKDNDSDEIKFIYLDLKPNVDARKSYFNCLYQELNQTYDNIFKYLEACIEKVKEWILKETQSNGKERNLEGIVKGILDDMGFSKPEPIPIKKSVVIPVQNVEIFYSIGQTIDKIMIPTINKADELFKLISSKYHEIQKILHKIDEYNEKLHMPTKFEEEFMNTYQARLLLGKIELSDSLREKFKKKFGELLSEVYGVNLTKVSEPES